MQKTTSLILIAVVIILGIGIYTYLRNAAPYADLRKTQAELALVSDSKPSIPLASLDDIPTLYHKLNWTELPNEQLQKQAFGVEDTYQTGDLRGKKWEAIQISSDPETITLGNNEFYHYTLTQMEIRGWRQAIRINGHRVFPLVADGPNESIWGYIGTLSDTFRVVVFSQKNDGTYTETGGEPPQLTCPCTTTYGIFVSDITPVKDIF